MTMCGRSPAPDRRRRGLLRAGMCGLLLALGLAAATQRAAAVETSAHELVRMTAEQVQQILQQRHAELEQKPGLIYGVVEEYVLPHFDFVRMSQLVLGKNWRTATPEEKARLWPIVAEVWPAYNDYQARTERDIPVVILERA